jgi:Na+-transporting methylmalonyl-CoA/oxaloacetate decarboxylase gamma subunit
MGSNILVSLQITALGMGLVFAAIILLWGLMAILVRLTAERSLLIDRPSPAAAASKQQAATAAVAVALALLDQNQLPPRLAPPPTAIVSAWQAVMRSTQLKQRGPVRR